MTAIIYSTSLSYLLHSRFYTSLYVSQFLSALFYVSSAFLQ